MATLTIVCRPSKEKDGSVPLYLRLAHQGTTRYLSLRQRVPKTDWNRGRRRVRSSHPDHRDVNAWLQEVKATAERAVQRRLREAPGATAGELKAAVAAAAFGPDEEDDFGAYVRRRLSEYREQGRYGSADRIEAGLAKLLDYHEARAGTRRIAFADLTGAYLKSAIEWMRSGGLAENTISGYLGGLRTLYYDARREGKVEHNPWGHVRLKTEKKGKAPLTREEFQQLKGIELDRPFTIARDLFVFAVHALGMRFGDVATLTPENVQGGRLRYQMRKNGKTVDAKLPGEAERIIGRYRAKRYDETKYIFPVLRPGELGTEELLHEAIGRATTRNNARLRKIRKRMGLEKKLTFHVARDTFTALALEAGKDVRWVQAALKHSSLRTTERYIARIRPDEIDEGLDDIFGE